MWQGCHLLSLWQIRSKGSFIAQTGNAHLQASKLSKKLLGQSVVYTERLLAPKAAATGKLTILKSLAKPDPKDKKKNKGKGRM